MLLVPVGKFDSVCVNCEAWIVPRNWLFTDGKFVYLYSIWTVAVLGNPEIVGLVNVIKLDVLDWTTGQMIAAAIY